MRRHLAVTARALAALAVLAGVVLLAWVCIALHTSAVQARAQQDHANQLTQQWQDPTIGGAAPALPSSLALGQAFAVLHIPALGADWSRPVVQGVDAPQLRLGVGHYPSTVGPGQPGTFGVAAHSSGNGASFDHLDRLHPGDPIEVTTAAGTLTYRVTGSRVVAPTQVSVLAASTTPTMVLTTCYPVYSLHPDRLVVFAALAPSPAP